jgi:3-oxoacyl-[acyl-carrier protein] reductase
MRSLAKEVGRRGATANLLWLEPGAEAGLAAPLAFFGGPRSAYVSGRTLRLTAAPIPAGHGLGGRTAVVTGAARGLGAATAERLAAEGARVLCVDVPAAGEPLEALARRLGGQALGWTSPRPMPAPAWWRRCRPPAGWTWWCTTPASPATARWPA